MHFPPAPESRHFRLGLTNCRTGFGIAPLAEAQGLVGVGLTCRDPSKGWPLPGDRTGLWSLVLLLALLAWLGWRVLAR